MKAIILVLIPIGCVALGFWFGRVKTPASKHYEQMYRVSNQRFTNADDLINRLSTKAAEHSMLGDTFAWIVHDEIQQYWKKDGRNV